MPAIPKFVVLSEQLRGQMFELNQDEVTIGRSDERTICLKDPTVSTLHCKVTRSGDKLVIADAGSTNGTKVNNVPITEHELKNSDLILFGAVEVLFDGDPESEGATTFQPTVTLDLSLDSGLSTAPSLSNLNPLAEKEEKKREVTHRIMVIAVAIAGLLMAGLLIYMIINIIKGTAK